MSKNRGLIIGLGVGLIIAVFVGAYLYFENKKLTVKIKEVEDDKLKLILDSLTRNPDISTEIKTQIEKLVVGFKDIDEKVSNELVQALQLIQIGQTENAIEDLVKIIEHLLTVHYKENLSFKKWLKEQKKKIDLHNLLTFCKSEEKIDDVEYHFFIAIKTIRNKEDHTVDLKLDTYLNVSGLITAIGGIFKMAKLVYPNTKNS
jgi:hypothetical protein